MRGLKTIIFLFISNTFMTFAWYGHLKFKEYSWGKNLGLVSIILISWGLAFFEYVFQVPANRAGSRETGGPFSLVQLKTIQEAVTLTVFMIFTLIFFKTEKLAWNHLLGFCLIVLAVFVIFKKW
ncbi:MAG TPA: DMT family protein [Mucilaginibacter sp.]